MQTISYIKEGKEVTTNKLSHQFFGTRKAYLIKLDHLKRKEIEVLENVELLHFRNFNFTDTIRFHCQNKDTILILEDCNFENHINFHQGNIVLDKPSYIGSFPDINFFNNDEVELILDDKQEENRHTLEKCYTMNSRVKSLTVTGKMISSCIKTLSSVEKLHLKNLTYKQFRNGAIYVISNVENIKIEGSDIEEFSLSYWCKNLEIRNSTIKATHSIDTRGSNVVLENTSLKAPQIISCKGIYTQDEKLYFSTNDSEASGNRKLAETSIISSLKALTSQAERSCQIQKEQIAEEVAERYEETLEDYQRWLRYDRTQRDYYESEIEKSENAIKGLETEKREVMNNVNNCLKKQKIKTLVSTNKK